MNEPFIALWQNKGPILNCLGFLSPLQYSERRKNILNKSKRNQKKTNLKNLNKMNLLNHANFPFVSLSILTVKKLGEKIAK